MNPALKWLFDNTFGFDRPDSRGERFQVRLVEIFTVVATVWLAWKWGLYLTRISDVVLPLGLAHYIDVSVMFNAPAAYSLATAISVAAVLGFLNVHRSAYMVSFLGLVFMYASRFCLGEIPHSANLAAMTLLGFALAHAFFEDPVQRRRFAFGFTVLAVGTAYTEAGVSKLIATGVTWPDGRHLWLWINEKSIDHGAKNGFVQLNWFQQLCVDYWWVATASLTVGLVSELTSFLFWSRRLRPFIMVSIIGMHLGILLSMNILFKLSIIELLLVGLPIADFVNARWPKDETPPNEDGSSPAIATAE